MEKTTLAVGDKLIVDGSDINSRGQGVAKLKDLPVIFVDNLLPRESAEVEITEVKKDYAIGKIKRFLRVSPLRMDPLCPYYQVCGGCQLQHLAYPHQFHLKLQKVQREMELHLKEHLPLDKYYYSVPLRYRNKLTFHIRGEPQNPKIGFFKMDSHDVVDVSLCLLAHPAIEEAYIEFRKVIEENRGRSWVVPYNEEEGKGLLRAITFRVTYPVTADASEYDSPSGITQVMAILTLNLKDYTNKSELLELERAVKALKRSASFLLDFNPNRGNKIFGGKTKLLKGRLSLRQSFITRTIGKIHYFFGPYNFFQINPWVTIHMIDTAVEWMGDSKGLLDLYCGVGLFGIALAKAGVKKVDGVEVDSTVKKYVKKTLMENSIPLDRFRVHVGKAEEVSLSLSDYDGVIVDPPRKGLTPDLIKKLSQVKKVLYFSCNPSTLARDLIAFKSLGFSIVKVRAFDMFPQTTHLELGVLLQK